VQAFLAPGLACCAIHWLAVPAQASCQRLRPHLGTVLFQFPANFKTSAAAKSKGQPPINNIDRLRRLGEVRCCVSRCCIAARSYAAAAGSATAAGMAASLKCASHSF